jgi:hypothetical protein
MNVGHFLKFSEMFIVNYKTIVLKKRFKNYTPTIEKIGKRRTTNVSAFVEKEKQLQEKGPVL